MIQSNTVAVGQLAFPQVPTWMTEKPTSSAAYKTWLETKENLQRWNGQFRNIAERLAHETTWQNKAQRAAQQVTDTRSGDIDDLQQALERASEAWYEFLLEWFRQAENIRDASQGFGLHAQRYAEAEHDEQLQNQGVTFPPDLDPVLRKNDAAMRARSYAEEAATAAEALSHADTLAGDVLVGVHRRFRDINAMFHGDRTGWVMQIAPIESLDALAAIEVLDVSDEQLLVLVENGGGTAPVFERRLRRLGETLGQKHLDGLQGLTDVERAHYQRQLQAFSNMGIFSAAWLDKVGIDEVRRSLYLASDSNSDRLASDRLPSKAAMPIYLNLLRTAGQGQPMTYGDAYIKSLLFSQNGRGSLPLNNNDREKMAKGIVGSLRSGDPLAASFGRVLTDDILQRGDREPGQLGLNSRVIVPGFWAKMSRGDSYELLRDKNTSDGLDLETLNLMTEFRNTPGWNAGAGNVVSGASSAHLYRGADGKIHADPDKMKLASTIAAVAVRNYGRAKATNGNELPDDLKPHVGRIFAVHPGSVQRAVIDHSTEEDQKPVDLPVKDIRLLKTTTPNGTNYYEPEFDQAAIQELMPEVLSDSQSAKDVGQAIGIYNRENLKVAGQTGKSEEVKDAVHESRQMTGFLQAASSPELADSDAAIAVATGLTSAASGVTATGVSGFGPPGVVGGMVVLGGSEVVKGWQSSEIEERVEGENYDKKVEHGLITRQTVASDRAGDAAAVVDNELGRSRLAARAHEHPCIREDGTVDREALMKSSKEVKESFVSIVGEVTPEFEDYAESDHNAAVERGRGHLRGSRSATNDPNG